MRVRGESSESVDVVIIGAGQAGITTSYFLKQSQIEHIVLEREQAFSQWHTRWDSFKMNTANWMNALPGARLSFAPGANRDGLGTLADALHYFQDYLEVVNPPIEEHTEVTQIIQADSGAWRVITPGTIYECANVVLCTGNYQLPRIPSISADLPDTVSQMHSSEYRNPEQIPPRDVLVVGSGNSGVQICEDLARSKRFDSVTLAVSGNIIIPDKVMGIPTYSIMRAFGMLDIKANSWLGKQVVRKLKGKGVPAFPPTPSDLARNHGVKLVGRVIGVGGNFIHCSHGKMIPVRKLSIVWCTGYLAKYDIIQVQNRGAVFDDDSAPIHQRGVSLGAPGLYFVGLRFQYTVTSQDLYGVGRAAKYVAQHIITHRRWDNVP